MKFLILLPILFASFVLSEENNIFSRSLDAGKTDPLTWMILNQLQASQTKLANLDNKLDTKISKLSEKLTNVENMSGYKKQFDTLTKHLNDVETKLHAFSGKMSDLKNDINKINQGRKNKCNTGWKKFNGCCYMFRYDRLSWQQAKTECENNNAHLVKIESSTENRWISNEITVSAKATHVQIWTGLNDLIREGHFTWVNDHSSVGYSNWASGEPSNYRGVEHCVTMHTNGLSTWNDQTCSYKTGYICEK
ncbi:perlucin-like protein [Mytilus galloprovincialis]|uniref:perlucin-like protein n=1 Tax=Mytilus galloprovincialis TaxID=29158 RepID=UPI003F7C8FA2